MPSLHETQMLQLAKMLRGAWCGTSICDYEDRWTLCAPRSWVETVSSFADVNAILDFWICPARDIDWQSEPARRWPGTCRLPHAPQGVESARISTAYDASLEQFRLIIISIDDIQSHGALCGLPVKKSGLLRLWAERLAEPQQWEARYEAVFPEAQPSLDEATLTKPDKMLEAFASAGTTDDKRRTLVLFSETLRFDLNQRTRLLSHLWDYISRHRATDNEPMLVAIGAAMRKLIAYWPTARFDELAALVEFAEGDAPAKQVEMEFAKALVYRFSWDAAPTSALASRLCDVLYELVLFHSSKRALAEPLSAAIAVNAIVAMAFLADPRILEFARSMPRHSLPWFMSFVRSQAVKHRAQTTPDRSTGLLPDLITALPAPATR